MKDYLKIVGTNIRKIRELRDMSQQQLAIKCGHKSESARSWISKIESGERSTHTDDIGIIATALDVPPSTLYIEFGGNNLCEFEKRMQAYIKSLIDIEGGD